MDDYAVTVKVRNGRILRRMRDAGINTQTELARRAGLPNVAALNAIINLRSSPRDSQGEWQWQVIVIADVLQCDPEDLFTEAQQTMKLEHSSVEVFMGEPEVQSLAAGSGEEKTWAKIEAQRLLETLPPRARFVVEEHAKGRTRADIGDELNVSRERVRQIEEKAFRQLRGKVHRENRAVAQRMLDSKLQGDL